MNKKKGKYSNEELIVLAAEPQIQAAAKKVTDSISELCNLSKTAGFSPLRSSELTGKAMKIWYEFFLNSVSDEELKIAFPKTHLVDMHLERKKILNSTNNAFVLFSKLPNLAEIKIAIERSNQKSPLLQKAESLFNSGTLAQYTEGYKKGVFNSKYLSKIYISELCPEKSSNCLKKLMFQYGEQGIALNTAKYHGIKENADLIENIIDLFGEIATSGLSPQQKEIFASNNPKRFMEVKESLSERKKMSKKQEKAIEAAHQTLVKRIPSLALEFHTNYTQANLGMAYRLFSNRWYPIFEEFLLTKSQEDSHERIPLAEFLELSAEEQKKHLVSCSIKDFRDLSYDEQCAVMPRLADSTFKQLEFYEQFTRMAFWDAHTQAIREQENPTPNKLKRIKEREAREKMLSDRLLGKTPGTRAPKKPSAPPVPQKTEAQKMNELIMDL